MTWQFDLVDGPYGGVTEGPAWDGSGLLFTPYPYEPHLEVRSKYGLVDRFPAGANYANGLMLDPGGTLYACEAIARRMVRYEEDGSTTVLADGFEGKRLNIPNDVAIDLEGRVWFTDPYYEGAAGPWSEEVGNKDLDHDSVYRLDEDGDGGWSITRATYDTTRPNGLLFSLDHDVLYVAQSGRREDEYRQLRGYPVLAEGSLGEHTVLHDFGAHRGIDGMVLDTEGNIGCHSGVRAERAWADDLRVRAGRRGAGDAPHARRPADQLHVRRRRPYDAVRDDRRRPPVQDAHRAPGTPALPVERQIGSGGLGSFHPHLNPLPSRERRTLGGRS